MICHVRPQTHMEQKIIDSLIFCLIFLHFPGKQTEKEKGEIEKEDLRGDLLVHVKDEANDVVDDVEDNGAIYWLCRCLDLRLLLHHRQWEWERDLKLRFRFCDQISKIDVLAGVVLICKLHEFMGLPGKTKKQTRKAHSAQLIEPGFF